MDIKSYGKRNNRSKSGFTLAELLVVVAIIAVLIAVSVITFPGIMEKGRESTDLANIRSAYAEVSVEAVGGNYTETRTVKMKQKELDWVPGSIAKSSLEAIGEVSGVPKPGGTCVVSFDETINRIVFTFDGTPSRPYAVDDYKDWVEVGAKAKQAMNDLVRSGSIIKKDNARTTAALLTDPVMVDGVRMSVGDYLKSEKVGVDFTKDNFDGVLTFFFDDDSVCYGFMFGNNKTHKQELYGEDGSVEYIDKWSDINIWTYGPEWLKEHRL